jgi:membrane protein YdbS with pleckstrin-like domain
VQDPKNRLSRSVVKLWLIVGGLGALLATAVLVAASAIFDLPPWIPIAGAAVAFALAVILPPLRYRRWRYEIRSDDLYFSKGALWLVRTLVPFDRIQYVETRQGPVDRAFDLHQLVVYTGAGRAGTIPGLESHEAQALRDHLSKVAGAVSL